MNKFRITFEKTGESLEYETMDSREQVWNAIKLFRPNEEFTIVELVKYRFEGNGIPDEVISMEYKGW